MPFNFQSAHTDADGFTAEVDGKLGHERENNVLEKVKDAVTNIVKAFGGYVAVSVSGHVNEDEGLPGDSVNVQINSLLKPNSPTPDAGAAAALSSTAADPPEATTSNPMPADGSPPADQPANPEMGTLSWQPQGTPPVYAGEQPAGGYVQPEILPNPLDPEAGQPVVPDAASPAAESGPAQRVEGSEPVEGAPQADHQEVPVEAYPEPAVAGTPAPVELGTSANVADESDLEQDAPMDSPVAHEEPEQDPHRFTFQHEEEQGHTDSHEE